MATLGSLRSGFHTVFVGRVWGRRLWNLCIDEFFTSPGLAPSASVIQPEKDLRLFYGKSRNDLWSGSLASSLRIRIFDPGARAFERFEAARLAGEGDQRFRARLSSADGLYSWEGWLRLDTADRPLSSITDRQITEIYAYDGLADPDQLMILDGVEASFHASARNVLAYSIAPLPIRYLMEFTGTNIGAGALMPRIELSPLGGIFALPAPITRGAAFEEMIRAVLCRSWQGMNGEWWIAQPWLQGRNLAASGEGSELFAYLDYDPLRDEFTEVAGDALSSRAFQHREGRAGRKARRGIYSVDSIYELTRTSPQFFIASQFHQDFTFSALGWDGDVFRYGLQTGDITFDTRGQFAASMEFGPSAEWENERHIFDAGSEIYFALNFIWMAERDGGSGDKHFEFEIEARAIESGDTTNWLKSDGTWTTVPTTLTTSDETPDANGSDPLTEHETNLIGIEPVPIKCRIYMRWRNPDANDRLFLTRHWLRPANASGGDLDQPSWKTTCRRFDGAGEPKGGDTLKRDSRVVNLSRQTGIAGTINVYNDTRGAFEQLSRWLRLSVPGTDYADLAELQASLILSEETEKLREFSGPLVGIHPPEDVPVFNCVPYVWLEGFIDLISEITEARYAEKPFSHDLT